MRDLLLHFAVNVQSSLIDSPQEVSKLPLLTPIQPLKIKLSFPEHSDLSFGNNRWFNAFKQTFKKYNPVFSYRQDLPLGYFCKEREREGKIN